MTDLSHIRNFAIIAHVDHGKSTLADRLIQQCGAVDERDMKEQMLDSMDIERERGITIKAQTVRLWYVANNGCNYQLNLIDTPGHVDFAYEVSRSLAACEGSLLLVDSTQGVEAQTIANAYQALDVEHKIILVINKVDLPAAAPDDIRKQVEDLIGLDASQSLLISAKSGLGVKQLLESLVERLPSPKGKREAPLRALLIDSWYDVYLGVTILVRVQDGILHKGQNIRMMATEAVYRVEQIGYFSPIVTACDALSAGEIGYITAGIKAVKGCRVGDTITDESCRATVALPGFKQHTPVVFCGLFPVESSNYTLLRDSLTKLSLNDASFVYEPEISSALGLGFRCGFLGLLHMEIIQERLAREFKLELTITAPSVVYRIYMTNGSYKELYNPSDMPDHARIRTIEEPWILATILVPSIYLGSVLTLCAERRGQQCKLTCVSSRAMIVYQLPLNEVMLDFYDRLKSISHGYASLNYEAAGYHTGDLVRVNILVNGDLIGPMSFIIHRSTAVSRGRQVCERLRNLIPRHLFQVSIQASIGGRIIARETIPALRKDVTAKCYGGDVTRKRKLLEKQKEGKKKMRRFGRVEIPQSAFIQTLRLASKQ